MCSLLQYQTPSLRKDILYTLHKLIPDVLPVFMIVSMIMKVTEEEARAFHIKRWGGWTASYNPLRPLLTLSSMIHRDSYNYVGGVEGRKIKGWGWTMPSIPVSLLRDIEIMNSGSEDILSLLGIRERTCEVNKMNNKRLPDRRGPDYHYHTIYDEWAHELTNISSTLSDPFMEFWVKKDTYIRICIDTERKFGKFGETRVVLRIKNDIFETHDLLTCWRKCAPHQFIFYKLTSPHIPPLNIRFPPEFILTYKQKIDKFAIPAESGFGTSGFDTAYDLRKDEIRNTMKRSFQWWEYPGDLD